MWRRRLSSRNCLQAYDQRISWLTQFFFMNDLFHFAIIYYNTVTFYIEVVGNR